MPAGATGGSFAKGEKLEMRNPKETRNPKYKGPKLKSTKLEI